MMQMFFLFAGYLFFIRYDSFGMKEYITSIRHKSRTLFIPYILWCTIASVLSIIQSGSFDTIDTNLITDLYWCGHGARFTVTPFGNVIPLISSPSCNGVLWFIRDLIVMFLLSPLVWLIGKLSPRITIPLLLLCALLHVGIPYIGSDAPIWFTLGAIFAIRHIDFVSFSHRHALQLISIWGVLAVIYMVMHHYFDPHHLAYGAKSILEKTLTSTIGVFAYIAIAYNCLYPKKIGNVTYFIGFCKKPINRWLILLSPTSFFLYMVHFLPGLEENFHLTSTLISNQEWEKTLDYLSTSLIKITVIPLLFFAMRRYTPRLLSILTGGRSSRTFQSPEKLLTLQSEKLTESPNC